MMRLSNIILFNYMQYSCSYFKRHPIIMIIVIIKRSNFGANVSKACILHPRFGIILFSPILHVPFYIYSQYQYVLRHFLFYILPFYLLVSVISCFCIAFDKKLYFENRITVFLSVVSDRYSSSVSGTMLCEMKFNVALLQYCKNSCLGHRRNAF